MATLHIPYYRSDVPVVRYTENINSGVMVIQPHDNINYIAGNLLTPTSNYFKTSNNQNTYSSILCISSNSDGIKRLGSFNLPDKKQDGSYVLTYSNHETTNAKYTWTNIEDIALSKCFTSSTNTINTTSSLIISYNNSAFHFDNDKYVYNLLIDGYIDIDIESTNNIVKQNSNIFVLINDSSASNLSLITSGNDGGIDLPLFYKYTANVTDTTATKKRLYKFIPDFKTATTNDETNICLTLITANMKNNVPNNIQQLKPLNIVCSVMITENRRIQ